ncbi:type IV pilus modification protein PilV [Salinisphaera sp. G21_0]|uniref:type IV pilus modification protein PilV n=1 Tax=Salinisphaera sp. G21_0 TaxID=2821094 RepID=UPI001AD9B922|nr:type IV pilus modification protein PilV [Salinisphaera sp. G21_0]MBO9481367.1 type IV pilus modification protein PilV [Salinisphaera sp. G21_0]
MTNSVRPINTEPGLLSLAAVHKTGWQSGPVRQKGIGLVEVMIGVLIFAGGVMAVTGMQSQAIRANHDAIQRSQAVWMANAAAELMRLNPAGLPTYVRESSVASANLDAFCQGSPPYCIGTTCAADLMASFDMYGLMCSSANTMIEPKMDIQCDGSCGPTDKVRILVSWGARGSEKGVLADRQQVELRYNRN